MEEQIVALKRDITIMQEENMRLAEAVERYDRTMIRFNDDLLTRIKAQDTRLDNLEAGQFDSHRVGVSIVSSVQGSDTAKKFDGKKVRASNVNTVQGNGTAKKEQMDKAAKGAGKGKGKKQGKGDMVVGVSDVIPGQRDDIAEKGQTDKAAIAEKGLKQGEGEKAVKTEYDCPFCQKKIQMCTGPGKYCSPDTELLRHVMRAHPSEWLELGGGLD